MKVVILGAGGHGHVVADIIRSGARLAGDDLEVGGFLDDRPELAGTIVAGAPVLGTFADLGRCACGCVRRRDWRQRHASRRSFVGAA